MTENKNSETNTGHKNIYSALSALQKELKPIVKNQTVAFQTKGGKDLTYQYASLDSVFESVYELLGKHGLSVNHKIGNKTIECILTHETADVSLVDIEVTEYNDSGLVSKVTKTREVVFSNQLSSGEFPIFEKEGMDMKDKGADLTYARRYTLSLVLGLATEEDKDAQIQNERLENTGNFAYRQIQDKIKTATPEKLAETITFLEGELNKAIALDKGESKVVPSLGLKTEQYTDLLKIANDKKNAK